MAVDSFVPILDSIRNKGRSGAPFSLLLLTFYALCGIITYEFGQFDHSSYIRRCRNEQEGIFRDCSCRLPVSDGRYDYGRSNQARAGAEARPFRPCGQRERLAGRSRRICRTHSGCRYRFARADPVPAAPVPSPPSPSPMRPTEYVVPGPPEPSEPDRIPQLLPEGGCTPILDS